MTGSQNNENEDMSPSLRSMVVKDWLVAMGGQQLFEHVCRVYSKDLEVSTLADIQHRIAQNLESLQSEIDSVAGAVRALTFLNSNSNRKVRFKSQSMSTKPKTRQISQPSRNQQGASKATRTCILCKAMGRTKAMTTHSLAKCYLVDQNDISEMAKIQMAVAEEREFAESSSSATENSDDQD